MVGAHECPHDVSASSGLWCINPVQVVLNRGAFMANESSTINPKIGYPGPIPGLSLCGVYIHEVRSNEGLIRLLIADDHTLMREGLKQLFAMLDDVLLVGEAVNGTQVLERLRSGDVDLLLLDMNMPGMSGDGLISRIRAQYSDVRILVLSMHNEPQIAARALKAGASGYLTKDGNPESLIEAVRRVSAGGRFLDSSIAQSLAYESSGLTDEPRHSCLSDREYQIMQLLAKGNSLNEIADMLFISNKTVSTHKVRMMEKMGFKSTVDLVHYVIEHNLIK